MDYVYDQQLILHSQEALVSSVPDKSLIEELQGLFVDAGHAHQLRNTLAVTHHVFKAILAHQNAQIDKLDCMTVMLAALLHSADDSKLFPDQAADEYRNARHLLRKTPQFVTDRVLLCLSHMRREFAASMDLEILQEPWWHYPHLACQLEATELERILLCYDRAQSNREPLFIPETPRARSSSELTSIMALPWWSEGRHTFIDLVYHKLALIDAFAGLTDNVYFLEMAQQRISFIHPLLIEFGSASEGKEEAAISRWVCSMRSSMG